jgi:DNA primase
MAGRIPDTVIDEVARRIDLVELVGNYVQLEKKGARFVGLCPFHSEKTPSFSVDRDAGLYYCFGCHAGGGAFKFLMEMEGLSFPEAVRQLGEQVGVEVEAGREDEGSRQRRALGELYNRVARTFAYFLHADAGAEARAVLEERAVSHETLERFGVGFAPKDPFWLHRFLTSKGYSDGFLRTSGLFTRGNPHRALFAGRIIFPIRSRRGDVVAFGGRIVDGDGPKYINSPETPIYQKREQLFGIDLALQAIRRERHVVVAEGYMDVIALHQSGVETAIAPLGTAFTAEQGKYLSRYIERATLLFDADEAGARATRRTAEILEPYGVAVSVSPLEPGSDPADLLQRGGSQQVRNTVSSSLTVLEFLVRQSLQEHTSSSRRSTASPETKDAVLREVYPYVALMSSQVKREESLRLISDLVGADEGAVRRDFSAVTSSSGARASDRTHTRRDHAPAQHTHARKGTALSHDLFLMLATVQSREHFAFVRRYIQPEDLEDAMAREVYLAMEESFRRGETSLEALLGRITKPDVVELVQERVASGEFAEHGDRAIRDAVGAIRRRVLLQQRRAVEAELRRMAATEGEAGGSYLELLSEKMHLDRELEKLKGEG